MEKLEELIKGQKKSFRQMLARTEKKLMSDIILEDKKAEEPNGSEPSQKEQKEKEPVESSNSNSLLSMMVALGIGFLAILLASSFHPINPNIEKLPS